MMLPSGANLQNYGTPVIFGLNKHIYLRISSCTFEFHKMLRTTQIKVQILKMPWNKINFGFVDTIYGQMVVGASIEDDIMKITYLHFSEGRPIAYFANDISKQFPETDCVENEQMVQTAFSKLFLEKDPKLVYVVLNGSEFQIQVSMALLNIPYGEERTYLEVADMIGRPKAVRAVASAIAKNNIALFVPCHRVKAKYDDKHKYRWGSDLKIKILLDEKQDNSYRPNLCS